MKKLMITLLATFFVSSSVRADSPVKECETQIESQKELQILKGKVELLFSADPPLEMLANNRVPNKKEKEAIAIWVKEQKKCKQLGAELFKNAPPEMIRLIDGAYSDMFFLVADLYEKKINYGAFAKGQVKVNDALKANMTALKQQLRQQEEAKMNERRQQQAIEDQRRQNE